MRKKAFSITIDAEVYQCLKESADQENRKLSNLIETIIIQWLDNNKKRSN